MCICVYLWVSVRQRLHQYETLLLGELLLESSEAQFCAVETTQQKKARRNSLCENLFSPLKGLSSFLDWFLPSPASEKDICRHLGLFLWLFFKVSLKMHIDFKRILNNNETFYCPLANDEMEWWLTAFQRDECKCQHTTPISHKAIRQEALFCYFRSKYMKNYRCWKLQSSSTVSLLMLSLVGLIEPGFWVLFNFFATV